jgi:hypothetical protein
VVKNQSQTVLIRKLKYPKKKVNDSIGSGIFGNGRRNVQRQAWMG